MKFLQHLYLSFCSECEQNVLDPQDPQDLKKINNRIAEIAHENMISPEELKALLDKGRVIHSKALIGELHRSAWWLMPKKGRDDNG
jgi:uncharacterized iron-regulated protein